MGVGDQPEWRGWSAREMWGMLLLDHGQLSINLSWDPELIPKIK